MADPLRVLIVIKSLGPGGAERLVVDQLAHADADSVAYELFVCTPRDPNLLDEVAALDVPVHLGYDGRLPWPLRLTRLLRQQRYDIVHAHLPVAATGARLASLGSLPRRPRLVYTEHNRWPSYRPLTRWANWLTVPLDHLDIAVSADAAASMQWPTRGAARVVIHGVDRAALHSTRVDRLALRADLGLEPDHIVVGTVANLRREKDQAGFIEAFGRADLPPNCVLVIIGQGPLEAELRAHARRLDLDDRIRFAGYRSDATACMTTFDVFALPSRHEGRPVALMEAMALGLPVLVSDAGGMPDMVDDGATGLVVPAGDRAALRRALERLVGDPSLRDRLGRHAQAAAVAFDGSVAYGTIEAAYRELCPDGAGAVRR